MKKNCTFEELHQAHHRALTEIHLLRTTLRISHLHGLEVKEAFSAILSAEEVRSEEICDALDEYHNRSIWEE